MGCTHMKLSEWAKKQGISYKTAWRWYRSGRLPVPAYRTPAGVIMVDAGSKNREADQLRAEKPGAGRKLDLIRHLDRFLELMSGRDTAGSDAPKPERRGVKGRPLLDPGVKVSVVLNEPNIWPKRFTGIVEETYPKFAVVRVIPTGYRTTVHATDYGLVKAV